MAIATYIGRYTYNICAIYITKFKSKRCVYSNCKQKHLGCIKVAWPGKTVASTKGTDTGLWPRFIQSQYTLE